MYQKNRLCLISPTKYDWTDTASKITRNCSSIYEKAKAIYEWLIDNIEYDTSFSIFDADNAWRKHKGVCQAYCELYYRIGTAIGLDVRIITGVGKTSSNHTNMSENHCWIAIDKYKELNSASIFPEYIEYNEGEDADNILYAAKGLNTDNVIFVEPTWGAGTMLNGKYVKSNHDMSWFDVSPYWMIFTHYPQDTRGQLLGDYILSKEEFSNLPYILPKYEGYGFISTDLLSYFLQFKEACFPLIYPSYSEYVEFIDIPIEAKLQINKEYEFKIKKKKECILAIINEPSFLLEDSDNTFWTNNGNNIFTIKVTPKYIGKLFVSIRDENRNNTYNAILEYNMQL